MSATPEDRLARGEATEADLLVIVKRLGEDLLEVKDAVADALSYIDQGLHDSARAELERVGWKRDGFLS